MAASTRPPGRPRGAQQDPAARRAGIAWPRPNRPSPSTGPWCRWSRSPGPPTSRKATLYDNFDGKQGLTEALLDRYGLRVLESFAVGLASRRDRLGRWSDGGIEIFVRRHRVAARDVPVHRAQRRWRAVLADVAAPVAALIRSEFERQGLDPIGADALAHATLGAVFTATEWWGTQPAAAPRGLRRVAGGLRVGRAPSRRHRGHRSSRWT